MEQRETAPEAFSPVQVVAACVTWALVGHQGTEALLYDGHGLYDRLYDRLVLDRCR